ncbi:TPA: ead/Ea22-like family protein [Enterobacter kobei]
MSNIDKQALRNLALRATPGPWTMEHENIWYCENGYTKHLAYFCQGDDVDDSQDDANTRYVAAADPTTVLALLDELAFLDKRNAELNSTLERWAVDRAQSASELEEKDAQIVNLTAERDALRESEMGYAKHSNTRAAADIYFQLVEECEIPPGGSLIEYVSDLRERTAAGKGE